MDKKHILVITITLSLVMPLSMLLPNRNILAEINPEKQTKPSVQNATNRAKLTSAKLDTALVGSSITPIGVSARKIVKGLAYCIAALLLIVTLVNRFRSKKTILGNSPISILARTPIGAKSSLLLVSVEGRNLLLSTSSDDVKLLADLHTPASFAETISHFNQEADDIDNLSNQVALTNNG